MTSKTIKKKPKTKKPEALPEPTNGRRSTKIVSLHVEIPLYQEIVKRADIEKRSISNFITTWLEQTFGKWEVTRLPKAD